MAKEASIRDPNNSYTILVGDPTKTETRVPVADDDGHLQVDVLNPTANPETGLAKETTQAKLTSVYKQIEQANDNVTTINYTSSAKTDVSTIVQSSVTVGATATETFDNSGATTLVITRAVV